MIKLSQGQYPIYVSLQHIIAVKPDANGATKIVTTGHDNYSAFLVGESIDEVVAAISAVSNEGAGE